MYALVALLALGGIVAAAWLIDANRHDGRVLRRVELAGRDVGGLTPVQLRRVVSRVAADVEAAEVKVNAPDGGFSTKATDLGVRVDAGATERAVLRAGRSGSSLERFRRWLTSFTDPIDAPIRISVDADATWATVARLDPGPRTPPTEPSLQYTKGAFQVVDGKAGRGIDPADVIDELPDAAADGLPIEIEVDRGDVAPRYTRSAAETLAGRAQAEVQKALAVTAAGTKATVPVGMQRTWIRTVVTPNGLELGLDEKEVVQDVEKLLDGAGEPPQNARFTIDGGVRIIASKAGTACCDPKAVQLLQDAVLGDGEVDEPVDLPLRERQPSLTTEKAEQLGIKEVIGAFTTNHKGGEPRVANIHKIADLIRGEVLLPGESFSVNKTVGPRTTEKGFVAAPVIEEGRFSEDVGGGISQFATTLFNAAFFGGLDLLEYQSHSIYISRYPYGREATLSYPKPDLVIKNSTPHGVLIWPSYTNTSITVTLYSTKTMEVTQSGQTKEPSGVCTRVTTERTKTSLADGTKETDRIRALYRPQEGVNCQGQPTPTVTTRPSG